MPRNWLDSLHILRLKVSPKTKLGWDSFLPSEPKNLILVMIWRTVSGPPFWIKLIISKLSWSLNKYISPSNWNSASLLMSSEVWAGYCTESINLEDCIRNKKYKEEIINVWSMIKLMMMTMKIKRKELFVSTKIKNYK